jgi:hypothetical protein
MADLSTQLTTAQTSLEDGNPVAAFNTYKTALPLALATGDNASALIAARAMQGLLVAFGNSEIQSGGGRTKLEWDGEALDKIILRCQQSVSGSAGFSQQSITYARPTND